MARIEKCDWQHAASARHIEDTQRDMQEGVHCRLHVARCDGCGIVELYTMRLPLRPVKSSARFLCCGQFKCALMLQSSATVSCLGALRAINPVKPEKRNSLFGVPKNPSVLAQWWRAILCADEQLKENPTVRELHFNERYISRHFERTVNREVVIIDGKRPLLLPETVPTKFPNLPKYLSKPLSLNRKRQVSSALSRLHPARIVLKMVVNLRV